MGRATVRAVSALDPVLDAAYRGAEYVVHDRDLEIVTRVELSSAALAALLHRHGATRALLVSACNPKSRRLSDAENHARHAALCAELAAAGLTWLPAEGRAPDRSWREPSALVLGLGEAATADLMQRFDQRAVVVYDATGCGRLWYA